MSWKVAGVSDEQAVTGSFKENWPFFWISQINASYEQTLERRLDHIGIDIAQWRALMCLHDDKHLSVSEISNLSAQKLNTTTKVVQRMAKDHLVSTRVRPSDRRVTEVSLTEKGDLLRKEALQQAQKIFDQVVDDDLAHDMEALIHALSRLHGKLQQL